MAITDGALRVSIAAQSSPHRTQALATLCEQLNTKATVFPGTDLRLHLGVEPQSPVI
jgi:hypothetical protein